MAVIDIYIDGVLRSVKASSLSIDHQFSLRSTAKLRMESRNGSYTPTVGNDFKVYEDGDLIFGGLVTSVTRGTYAATSVLYSDVVAVDYSILAAKRLTGERYGTNGYVNQKANDILRDLVSNCLGGDGIDVSAIPAGAGPTITLAEFDYSTVAEAFDLIADLSARKWRIDFEKKLRLVDPSAPVVFATISGTSRNYLAETLSIEETQEQYHNKVVVRGKRTTIPEAPETFDGASVDQPTNGTRKDWTLANLVFATPTITVNGAAQDVGVASVDTGKDWYWRPSSAVIEQEPTASALTSSDTLVISYVGEQINQAFAENAVQIAARATVEDSSGIWERPFELDNPISVADLQEYANAALARRDDLSKKLVFSTRHMAGLFPGDGIDCNLTGLGNHTYIVTSLQINMETLGTPTPATNKQLITRRVQAQFGPILDNGFDYFKALSASASGASAGGAVSGGGSAPTVSPWHAITYASTITPALSNGKNQRCTLTGNVTVAFPTGATDGAELRLVLIQDATGGRTVSLATGWKLDGGEVVTLPNTKSIIDVCFKSSTEIESVLFNTGIPV